RHSHADRGGDAARARADPSRGRRADPRGHGQGDREGAGRRRPPPSDRGGRRDPRLQPTRAGDAVIAVAHRIYARALFEAAKEKGRLARVREELSDFVAAVEQVPELRELLRNPQLDPRAKSAALEAVLGDADELLRNFMLLLAEKGRSGQVEEIHREFERLALAEERRLEVELTTAVE